MQAELTSLGDTYKKLISGLKEERESLIAEHNQRLMMLEKEHNEKETKLIAETNKHKIELTNELNKKRTTLENERHALSARSKKLDDREHMHVRRELRDQISKEYKARKQESVVSSNASNLGIMVFVLTFLFGIVGIVYGAYSFTDMGNSFSWKNIAVAIRSSLSFIVGVSFIGFSINWLRRLYLDEVQTKREYEAFGDDIDRASYVIETILEVGEKEKVDVPDVWIEGACNNLFTPRDIKGQKQATSNAASLLLDIIAGAKFGPDGAELTVERGGIRHMKRQIKKET